MGGSDTFLGTFTGRSRRRLAMVGRLRFVGLVMVCLTAVGTASGVLAQVPGDAQSVSPPRTSPFTPPPCVAGVPFADVTCTTPYDAWIEQFGRDGITAGCGNGNYCPNDPVTRAQMAVFAEASMRGTANWPPHTVLVWAVKNDDGTPNPTASGQALLDGVESIPASGGDAPTASNPWVVRIGPGVFDLTVASLQMRPFVTIEGSGIGATEVRAVGGAVQTSAVVLGADDAALRDLALVAYGGAGVSSVEGVYNHGVSPTLSDLSVTASGGTLFSSGIENDGVSAARLSNVKVLVTGSSNGADWIRGIGNEGSGSPMFNNVEIVLTSPEASNASGVSSTSGSPILNHVKVTISTGGAATGVSNGTCSAQINDLTLSAYGGSGALGVQNSFSNVVIRNSSIDVSGGTGLWPFNAGVFNEASAPGSYIVELHNTRVVVSSTSGPAYTIFNNPGYALTKVAGSQLSGGSIANPSYVTCIGVYDANFQNANGFTSCP